MILEEKLASEAAYFIRIARCEHSSWRGIRAHRRRIDLSKPSTSPNDQYCEKWGDHRFFLEKVSKTAPSIIRPYATLRVPSLRRRYGGTRPELLRNSNSRSLRLPPKGLRPAPYATPPLGLLGDGKIKIKSQSQSQSQSKSKSKKCDAAVYGY